MSEIETLYSEIKQKLTETHLKELTSTILDAYKSGNQVKMKMYADALFEDEKHADVPLNRVFVKLIKIIHPDRFAAHLHSIEQAFEEKNHKKLSFYHSMLCIQTRAEKIQESRFSYEFTEEYRYGEEDFGYPGPDGCGIDPGEEPAAGDEGFSTVDFDFIHALKAEYLGNLSYVLSPADLAAFEGELNLAGYGFEDTEGLQYCRNITRLNLSGNALSNLFDLRGLLYLSELFLGNNNIVDIEDLKELENLEIVDLSCNEIEEIDVLLSLGNLQFADLRGNPVRDRKVLEELTRRGVVVLFP